MLRKLLISAAGLVVICGALLVVRVGGGDASSVPARRAAPGQDLSAFSDAPPPATLPLVFIHHSVGGRMLADPGAPKAAAESVWLSHPDGGGMRARLQAAGYQVNQASRGSAVGATTDLFDWLPKFRDQMDKVLKVAENDRLLEGDAKNRIVVFKSCYPNNEFVGAGAAPGNPRGPELTIANAQATMRELLPIFERHPETLFVFMTTPPLAPVAEKDRVVKWLAKLVLGRPQNVDRLRDQGTWSQQFRDWVVAEDGWLAGYPGKNVVVFDLYDVLTGNGRSHHLVYPTGGGTDSHPAGAGNQAAASAFVPFLNRAVRRAGLVH
jgi:hypothetical protein